MESVSYFTPPAIGYYGKRSIFHTTSDRLLWKTYHISRLGQLKHYKIQYNGTTATASMSFSLSGKRFFGKQTSAYRISQSQITHLKTLIKTPAPYLAGAYFTPPAIGYHGKRRIFHALDHLNIIKYNKTAQPQRQPCRFPRAGCVFSATNKFIAHHQR